MAAAILASNGERAAATMIGWEDSTFAAAASGPREAFAAAFDVPRETLAKFDRYSELLVAAQAKFNLVGRSTIAEVWTRHFADSAQLQPLGRSTWVDLGSGAGFPGLVLAILGERVELVESSTKKTAFLRAVVDQLDIAGRAVVRHQRFEAMERAPCKTIVARAVASLDTIFNRAIHFSSDQTRWILPKGCTYADEIEQAFTLFDFEVELVPSVTNSDSRIVVASAVRRKIGARRSC